MDKKVKPIIGETFSGYWFECPKCRAGWGGEIKEKCYNCGVKLDNIELKKITKKLP